jgi:hypothetical protein
MCTCAFERITAGCLDQATPFEAQAGGLGASRCRGMAHHMPRVLEAAADIFVDQVSWRDFDTPHCV